MCQQFKRGKLGTSTASGDATPQAEVRCLQRMPLGPRLTYSHRVDSHERSISLGLGVSQD